MSRIGKQPISLPKGVSVSVDKSNVVTVKGPKGELTRKVDPDIKVEVGGTDISVSRPTDQKRHKALHGLYRTLVGNMIQGVAEGYKTVLEVHGVGFKAEVKGSMLDLSVGYSHPIVMILPPEIKAAAETKRGEPPVITLESHDKELLGQIAAKIRSFRPPEPYKGKGIRFRGEQIRRKAGKAGGK